MLATGKDKYYYHADGLGSIVALTDGNGKIVQTYEYDSFGNLKDQKNRIKQPYTYTGREWDKETGLYYYRARYYDSMEGRFIQIDPIGFEGGDVNLWNYVQSNPVNFIDPLGHSKVTDLLSDYWNQAKKWWDRFKTAKFVTDIAKAGIHADKFKDCTEDAVNQNEKLRQKWDEAVRNGDNADIDYDELMEMRKACVESDGKAHSSGCAVIADIYKKMFKLAY